MFVFIIPRIQINAERQKASPPLQNKLIPLLIHLVGKLLDKRWERRITYSFTSPSSLRAKPSFAPVTSVQWHMDTWTSLASHWRDVRQCDMKQTQWLSDTGKTSCFKHFNLHLVQVRDEMQFNSGILLQTRLQCVIWSGFKETSELICKFDSTTDPHWTSIILGRPWWC